jgi:hypothetical protein
MALARDPSPYIPPPWGDRPVSFLRDIQPILDRHCVSCHSGLKPAGKLDFFGGLTDWSRETEPWWGLVPGYGFNRAFETINPPEENPAKRLVAIAEPNIQDATITPPMAFGAHRSKLFLALADKDHRDAVKLSADERLTLAMWIDANAPYHDRFVNKRSGKRPYDIATDRDLLKGLTAIHQRRCAECHKAEQVTRLDWIELRDAKKSLFLAAPLSKEAGGNGKCGRAVYRGAQDPDYRAALEQVQRAVQRQWAAPRRDVAALAEE